jgi:small subunit ribosomal protein S6
MIRYEALLLAVPTVTQDEAKTIESQLDQAIKEAKGVMISFERWGKYRLAFPIKKNEYGVYFLARFEAETQTNVGQALTSLIAVKLHDIVMRSMVSHLDSKASLAYQRPPSLEEAPTEKVGSFLHNRNDHVHTEDDDSIQDEVSHDEEN